MVEAWLLSNFVCFNLMIFVGLNMLCKVLLLQPSFLESKIDQNFSN
jgi:hypothetical protein